MGQNNSKQENKHVMYNNLPLLVNEWDDSRKKEYSNYRGYEYHLIPVFKSANREKSAYGPEVWLPENEDFHCGYINIWVEIKTYWDLTVNEKEYEKILEIISSC